MLFVATLLCAFLLLVPQGVPADLMLLFLGASCCLFGILSSKLLFKGCASDAVPRQIISQFSYGMYIWCFGVLLTVLLYITVLPLLVSC